jgi:molybdopterin/thiamine biosynthesis adenylyltransferase
MKKIVIVGVGALGSHIVMLLRNLGAQFKVVDFDKVEYKNTLSQFHGKSGIGKNKAVALQTSMKFLFGTHMTAVPHRLTVDNCKSLLFEADLIVDCLDNAESRLILQDYVRKTGKACLHGALAADGGFGRCIWDESFNVDSEDAIGTPTCADGEHLPFISLVASYMAIAVNKFLFNGEKMNFHVHPTGVIPV